ncbi:MAG: Spy/CpxP family protein refolding chaperone [Armatimonadota bacterium]|nr:periplasmic heavy metal sensor [bacterium]
MIKTLSIAAALAAVICTTPVWSQGAPPQGGPRGAGAPSMSCPAMAVMPPPSAVIDRAAETLQLTEDQTATLKIAMTTCDGTIKSLAQKATDASKALRDALVASEYDAQKAKDLAAAAEKAEITLINARIDEWTQIRAILTADQAKKLLDTTNAQRPGQGQRPAGPPPGGEDGFPPPGPQE